MNRAWGLGFLILVGCGAPASAQSPAGTSIQGASNPHQCEDAPPSEPKLMAKSLVDDVLLAGLDACTKTLEDPESSESHSSSKRTARPLPST